MQEWMLSFVDRFGYWGIFFLIFIENVFPPIPSEAVLLFGGAMTVMTAMNLPGTVLAATAGSLLGAAVLYAIGRIFSAEQLTALLEGRLGKITHLRPAYVQKAQQWFERYEDQAVLICRCVPLVRSLISIPAGFAGMPPLRFTLLTALGSIVWNTVLVCLGASLGTAWEKAMPYLERYTWAAAAVLTVLAAAAGVFYLLRRRKHRKNPRNEH